ncbi:MAG: hypothetical protein JXQ75_22945, partial [Phycisphaerae bacterium]|nr:hypothetical protein [Phycisphaerae bacterium]
MFSSVAWVREAATAAELARGHLFEPVFTGNERPTPWGVSFVTHAHRWNASSLWQNCGTGVSPVVFTVRNGVSEPLFSL